MLVRILSFTVFLTFIACQNNNEKSLEVVSEIKPELYCGSVPDTEAHFRYLKSLGIKSLISVDGAKPKVDMASKFNMKYIHIPYSYDKVPMEQQEKLIKAFEELPKPIFLHCHHGKHRAPVGSAVILRNHYNEQPESLVKLIETLGTSKSYSGLYKSVAEVEKIPEEKWQKAKLSSYEDPGSVAESMAIIDDLWDAVKKPESVEAQKHNILLLKENYFELARAEKNKELEKKYYEIHKSFEALELSISSKDKAKQNESLKFISGLCKSCHKNYRD